MSWSFETFSINPSSATCFHASAVCGEKLFLHGGYKHYPSQDEPSADIFVFASDKSVEKLTTKTTGPNRSHHTAVALDGKHICVVGGWDGKKRVNDVWVFDTEGLDWLQLVPTPKSNAPVGLSSHTCTLVKANEMIITGREGGVRTQRRYGSVFRLKVNLFKQTYQFEEMPNHISSRSGHTACLVEGKHSASKQVSVVIAGGRDSSSPDLINLGSSNDISMPNKDLQAIIEKLLSEKGKSVATVKPVALRHHASIGAVKWSIVHGGEVFGKVRDCTSGDIYVHDSAALKWWQVRIGQEQNAIVFKRFGHTLAWMQGRLYMVGGIGTQGKEALSTVVEIQFPS